MCGTTLQKQWHSSYSSDWKENFFEKFCKVDGASFSTGYYSPDINAQTN